MSDSYIQELFAQRIGGNQFGKSTAIYKFEKIKRAKRAALEANPGSEIIDMGVGEPDEMAFPEVIEQLHLAAQTPRIAVMLTMVIPNSKRLQAVTWKKFLEYQV